MTKKQYKVFWDQVVHETWEAYIEADNLEEATRIANEGSLPGHLEDSIVLLGSINVEVEEVTL